MSVHSLISIYRFFKSIHLLVFVVFFGVGAYVTLGRVIYSELGKEFSYRSKFGENWKASYERDFGTVGRARVRVAVSSCGLLLMTSGIVWLYRQLPKADGLRRSTRRRQSEGSPTSHDRHRSKRFAFLGVASGVFGIGLGICIVLFPVAFGLGATPDPEDPIIIGGGVFFAGYCALISGCYWWLKAKGWNEVLVIVGLLPLILLCIPFVRLALLAVPQILIVGMVMMPLILVIVILVLPDRSGLSRRRH